MRLPPPPSLVLLLAAACRPTAPALPDGGPAPANAGRAPDDACPLAASSPSTPVDAGAADAAPAASPASQALDRIRAGESAYALLDVGHGAWHIEAEGNATSRVAQLCGEPLLDEAILVEEMVRFCPGLGRECAPLPTSCTELACSLADELDRRFDVVFRRTDAGLRLHAVVEVQREGVLVPPVPEAKACAASAIARIPTDPAPPRERRESPGNGLNPTVPSRDLLDHLAKGDWPLERYVDRRSGFFYANQYGNPAMGPDDSPPPTEPSANLCGGELDRRLPAIDAEIRGGLIRTWRNPGQVSCRSTGGYAECAYGGTMEWDPVYYLDFRVDPERGLIAEGLFFFDEVQCSARSLVDNRIYRRQALRAYRAHPCGQ